MNLVKDIDLSPFMSGEEHQKVHPASYYLDAVLEDLYGDRSSAVAALPWGALLARFEVRSGEMSLWAGQNGTGKSLLLSQAMASFMAQGQGVFLASFELAPARSIRRMIRQASRTDQPTEDYVRRWHQWTDRRLWIFDHQGAFSGTKMLAVLRWVKANLPVHHVVVDSLMKLEIATDDYAAQKSLVNRMHSFSIESGLHVHLVAHARKSEKETDAIDKFSVKGASEIVDQVDNVILVTRNTLKERQMEKWQQERRDFQHPTQDMADVLSKWDSGLRVAKQRHGDWEGAIPLWLDRRAQAFVDSQGKSAPVLDLSGQRS